MSKKKVIILIVVLLIILAAVAFAFWKNKNGGLNFNFIDKIKNVASDINKSVDTGETSSDASLTIVANPLGAMPGSAEAPKQELVAADKIPAKAIKLSVSSAGFSPKEFSIKAGEEVSLALTSTGTSSHVFLFPSASFMSLTMMVSNNETKVITFTAPDAGTYEFRDDIPEFRMNTGKMIVK